MLEFYKVKDPSSVKSILKEFDPAKHTWIVSDLKSKQEVQDLCLQQQSYYTDEAIMRISDFWKLWIRRLSPELNMVSSDFIKALCEVFVDEFGQKIEVSESETDTLYKAVQEFAPICLHPASDEIIREWLTNSNKERSWFKWYLVAKTCLKYLIEEKKVLDSQWGAAYLQNLDLNKIKWNRRIFLDLGSEMSSVEMGLFKHLAQFQDITVIMPDPDWKNLFPHLLKTYEINSAVKSKEIISEKKAKEEIAKPSFLRMSTQLSEVKHCVSQVRNWLDSGVNLNKIAIIGADIEVYWPALRFFLDLEGVPYQKDTVTSLNSLGNVQTLLAELQNYSNDVTWESLERTSFADREKVEFEFEKFKALFYQLYDAEDLIRDKSVYDLYYKKSNSSEEVDRDYFLAQLIKAWSRLPKNRKPQNQKALFEFLFKDVIGQSQNIKMKFKRWVQFLKLRLTHKELNLIKKSNEGVSVLSLMSANLNSSTHRVYLGLNDEYFHKKKNSLIPLHDAEFLKSQFDLNVQVPEENFLDFNLRWQSICSDSNYIYTTAHFGFSGETLNAGLFFIENLPKSEIYFPEMCRFDEINLSFKESEKWPTPYFNEFALKRDVLGAVSEIKDSVFFPLTASRLEEHMKCSFRLLAGRGFLLSDEAQVSIDLDPRQKGNIEHALFEECILKIQNSEVFESPDMEQFLDKKRLQLNIYISQEAYWAIQKKKLISVASRFYKLEKERSAFYSSYTEEEFIFYFDAKTTSFTKTASEDHVQFKIRIDRYDKHREKQYLVIYDYKSSSAQTKNYGVWLENKQIQLLLYIMCLELYQTQAEMVKGALYYQTKELKYNKGLIKKDIAIADFGFNSRNKCLIEDEVLENLKSEFMKIVKDSIEMIQRGEFKALPFDTEICTNCNWRTLCRAPHLL